MAHTGRVLPPVFRSAGFFVFQTDHPKVQMTMFTRRHPYLFFLLVSIGILSFTSIAMSLISNVGKAREMHYGEKVGVVELKGLILEAEPVLEQLKRFRKTEAVKAIVVRIDSPGGAVGPSQEIYREIRKTLEVKPVIASMGALAASGGYYAAAAADGIVANPGTITGSIGVIMEYTNFRELFEKIGIYPVVIKSGKYKDIGSPVRQLSEAEEKILQAFADNVHQQFIRDVAEGRRMEIQSVQAVADGRIFTGEQAVALGLVDRLGNLSDAVEWAGRKGGIKGEITTLYPPEEKFSLIRYLVDISETEIRSFLQRASAGSINGGYLFAPAAGQ